VYSHSDHNHGNNHHHGHSHNQFKQNGTIDGIIINESTGDPIEYVSVSVYNSTSNALIVGGITDSDGYFKINSIPLGEYFLEISFIGFETKIVKDISIKKQFGINQSLGDIKLKSQAIEGAEIKVVDDVPVVEFETDKMVYNPSDDIVANSGTAEDLLNKVPMVTVNQDGQVSLRGNPNVKILINGRPNRMGKEVDNIPADLVDKVEVITSPSAKYDPEGMAGIINIILKKGKFEGLNGSVKVNGKHNSNSSIDEINGTSLYANYQTDKFNIYSMFSLNNRMRYRSNSRDVYNILDNTKYYDTDGYRYESTTRGDGYSNSLTFGSDYTIDDNLKINAEINYKKNLKNRLINQEYFQDGMDDTNYIKESEEGDVDDNYHLESYLELTKSFLDPEQEIFASFSSHASIDSQFERQNQYNTHIDEEEDNYELDLNYKSPINEQSNFEIGYDGRFLNSKESMDFELEGLNGVNDFNMKRHIHGFFGEYQLELSEKLSIKPSLRLEVVDKNIEFIKRETNMTDNSSLYGLLLSASEDPVNIQEFNIFPNLSLTYNITKKKNIQFGISRRVKRPAGGHHGSWGQLRPFPRDVYNTSFIFKGNPFLKPEFSNQFEISYKSPMPMGFLYTNIYYRAIENSIEWYNEDLDNSVDGTIITFTNAERGSDFGLEGFMMVMGQRLGASYNANTLSNSDDDFQLNGKDERLSVWMSVSFPEEYIKIFGFEFGFYYMKMKTPGGTLFGDKGTIWADTGISKSLLDNRVNLSLSIDNIFDQGGFQMNTYRPTVDSNENEVLQYNEVKSFGSGRTLSINIKYHFGKMQEEKRRRRSGGGYGSGGGGGMDMGY